MTELAIHGGLPVRKTMLPYGRQAIDEDDVAAVVNALNSPWLTTGPGVSAFEEAFAEKVAARYAIAFSSGTAALHAAAFAAGIGQGDEVIVPPMTFAASANCVRYQGGKVVFADIRPDTLNLSPSCAEKLLSPNTRAIITVDYAGQPGDIDELNRIADKNDLVLIQDAAHSLGATYHGRKVGALSHMTTFSLHPVKHITTGEGGVVTTDDTKLAGRLRLFRNHGINADHRQREATGTWYYEMVELGYNYRLTDFQCALGLSQLKKLDAWIARRIEISARYSAAFSGMKELEPPTQLTDRVSSWHLYVIRLNLQRLTASRSEIFKALRAEHIGVNVHYIPVPWHPYYQNLGYEKGSWPVAEKAYERMISLPIFPAMTDDDVEDVVSAVKKVLAHYRK